MNTLIEFALSQLKPETADPCETFVVLTGSEKWEILDPEIYGPFASYREAYAWVAGLRNAIIGEPNSPWPGSIVLRPIDGGYMGFAIVNQDTCFAPESCHFDGELE